MASLRAETFGTLPSKAPRNELVEMGRPYVQDLQKSFVDEPDDSTFSYEFRAAVVARDYDALFLR